MKKTSKFQIIFLIVAIACVIGGIIAFATYRGSSQNNALPSITIWGTFPKSTFDQYVSQINYTLPQQMPITYVQESPDTFNQDFVSALARGTGPDAILIPADLLLPNEDKLTPVPYSALPQRTFINEYVGASSVYLTANGVMGLPFVMDPLVMYWNRDMFSSAGLVLCSDPSCATYWDEFSGFNQKITQKESNGTITKSAIALGDFTNVANAREIFASLLFQLGNPITVQNADGTVATTLQTGAGANPAPALQFFTQFVDPNNANYSWNRSWPNSKTAFLAANLATYFGFASELPDIRAKNPNLNFDIAPLPQARSGGNKAAYAKLYGFSITRASQNANAAYQDLAVLTSPQNLSHISATTYLPSVSTAVVAAGSNDPYMTIFNQEALVGKAWLDSDPSQSTQIFSSMVQSVTSGQKQPTEAINDAATQYATFLRAAVPAPSARVQIPVGTSITAAAVDGVPDVNLNAQPTNGGPFGAFKLVVCDGPDLKDLSTTTNMTFNGKLVKTVPGQNPPGYVPCDFKGLMRQMQYLINVMITLGVFGTIITLAYAGYLYIGGTQAGRNEAKDMFPKVAIGFVLMLTAWFIVYQILFWLTGSSAYLSG